MIEQIVNEQRKYFKEGNTLNVIQRKNNLLKIKKLLIKYYPMFVEAFKKDFNKCEFDVLSTEFLLVLNECEYMIKNITKLSKRKVVFTSYMNFPSIGYLLKEPYGVVLIMAPWNYPLQLSLEPLMGAIAAGNTVVIKPASYTKNVSQVIYDMFLEFNNPNLISVVLGGRNENQALLDQKFDYIFFTGGDTVGRVVLEKASKHLTPVSLELGGKSPCIVTDNANLDLAAKRITWGKFLNAGQTCVAPDFICVDRKIHDEFLKKVIAQIKNFYYENDKLLDTFPHLINERHKDGIMSYIDESKVVFGGKLDGLLLEPTVLDDVSFDDKIMQQEIFGPLMPIIIYDSLDELVNKILDLEKPLAFYFFSTNIKEAKKVLGRLSFGGGCLNDTIMHLTNDNLPFGGVGKSGMGSYHGKASFNTFSHQKSVLAKAKREINVKYPPNNKKDLKLLKKINNID